MGKGEPMRKHIQKIIWGGHVKWSHRFDYTIMAFILLSMITMSLETLPDITHSTTLLFNAIELVIVVVFTTEYVLRVWTAEKPLKYIFSFLGLVDLVAIVPFWLATGINLQGARAFRLIRMIRVLKVLRYMSALKRLERAIRLVQEELIVFGILAAIIIFVTSVGIYQFEHEAQPEAFPSIPHSIWFSIVSLTAVGYGDVTPITTGGKIFTSMILIIGLAIVAIPTALIVSGLTRAKFERKTRKEQD
jgi:voltage-gated potassium channel